VILQHQHTAVAAISYQLDSSQTYVKADHNRHLMVMPLLLH